MYGRLAFLCNVKDVVSWSVCINELFPRHSLITATFSDHSGCRVSLPRDTYTEAHANPPHHSHMSCWIRAMLVSRVIYMTVCNLNSSLSAQQKPKHLKHHTKAKLSLTRPWRAPYVRVCVWSMLLVVFLIVEYLHLPRPVHLHGP